MNSMLEVTWPIFKSFVDSRSLSIQWIDEYDKYFLRAMDGYFSISCVLNKSTDVDSVTDFETNFKMNGNLSPVAQVSTQFEAKNKTLKLFCAEADVQSDGTATILVAIPGNPGSGDGRWLNAGEAFFSIPNAGDKITGVWFIDHDNILGNGADSVIGSYTDDVANSENQGWYLPPVRGTVKAETIGFYGFAPSGFYIKITGQKAPENYTGKLFVNLEWAVTG